MPKCQNLRKAQIYLRYNLLDLLNPLNPLCTFYYTIYSVTGITLNFIYQTILCGLFNLP